MINKMINKVIKRFNFFGWIIKMATKKGLTTKALAKATKRLLEDIPSGIPKKKSKDESVFSKSAANKLINLHEKALKENKTLVKKIANLQKVVDEQKIKITTSGVERSVEDKIITRRRSHMLPG